MQNINCNVFECKHCNCDLEKCKLDEIKVCNCDCIKSLQGDIIQIQQDAENAIKDFASTFQGTPEEFSNFDYDPRSRPDLYPEKAWGIKIKIADKESELQYLDWKFK